MGRKVIDKVFDTVVRMDVTVRVHADSKDEAEAWVKERFALLLNAAVDSDFIPVEMLPTIQQTVIKKVKRPRRVKPAVTNPVGE